MQTKTEPCMVQALRKVPIGGTATIAGVRVHRTGAFAFVMSQWGAERLSVLEAAQVLRTAEQLKNNQNKNPQ